MVQRVGVLGKQRESAHLWQLRLAACTGNFLMVAAPAQMQPAWTQLRQKPVGSWKHSLPRRLPTCSQATLQQLDGRVQKVSQTRATYMLLCIRAAKTLTCRAQQPSRRGLSSAASCQAWQLGRQLRCASLGASLHLQAHPPAQRRRKAAWSVACASCPAAARQLPATPPPAHKRHQTGSPASHTSSEQQ